MDFCTHPGSHVRVDSGFTCCITGEDHLRADPRCHTAASLHHHLLSTAPLLVGGPEDRSGVRTTMQVGRARGARRNLQVMSASTTNQVKHCGPHHASVLSYIVVAATIWTSVHGTNLLACMGCLQPIYLDNLQSWCLLMGLQKLGDGREAFTALKLSAAVFRMDSACSRSA